MDNRRPANSHQETWVYLKAQWKPSAAAANSPQSCPTLCDPIDVSPPGSPIPGILQARTLEWVAISFSIAWKWKVKVKSLSRVRLLATPWTATYQVPPSMGFSRQEYWSGVPLPSLQNKMNYGLIYPSKIFSERKFNIENLHFCFSKCYKCMGYSEKTFWCT